tara:strand:- start:1417 stop:3567 length:2151 start_codon:yes stop_codon:yes gene_type:complete
MKENKKKEDLKQEEEKSMNLDELQGVLKSEMDDARDYIHQVGYDRAESTEYYLGNEPDPTSSLQSQYVSTDVRDSVLFMLPSIMRTFFGTKKIVEFVPKNKEDIPLAEQQTDYVNYVIQEQNPGFQVLYDVFKDALIRKTGYVKAFWDTSIQASTHEYSGLNVDQYQALVLDENVEILEQSVEMKEIKIVDEESGEEQVQKTPNKYDVVIRRVKPSNKVCIESVPPEEILLARNSRSLETSSYVAHRMIKSISDLVAMGYDKEELEQYGGYGGDILDPEAYEEQRARNPFDNMTYPDRNDPQGNELLYIEHYLFYDLDCDGIAERIRVCTVGDALNIINIEQWDHLPIVMFCPDPEPHTAIGSCPADYLKPIQAAKSQIVRDTLDSLGHSIFPRMGIVEGQVNVDDVLNTDIGQPIRMRAPGMVQPFSIPFVGKEAFPVLGYLDEAKENRTGVSKASAGLNADALQSSTKSAVSATMSAAQGRVELICRHFAESGLKHLFKLVNSLVIKHQEGEEIFRLNNKFIPVDPRYWDSNKDVVVNIALSKSSDEDKMVVLSQVISKQEQLLQQLGPNNPIVTPQQYANSLSRLIEMGGFKDPQAFINTQIGDIPPPPPPQPDPNLLLAQAEIEKSRVSSQKSIIDAETDRMKIIMDDDRDRDIEEAKIRLKIAELKARYGAQVDVAEINSLMERDREIIRAIAKTKSQGLFNNNQGGNENI